MFVLEGIDKVFLYTVQVGLSGLPGINPAMNILEKIALDFTPGSADKTQLKKALATFLATTAIVMHCGRSNNNKGRYGYESRENAEHRYRTFSLFGCSVC
jgi:hypothetical protein